MTRTVLITGGTGHLGGAVVAAFESAGWRVVEASQPSGYDLLSEADAARAVADAGADADAPFSAVAHLVGGFAAEQPIAETPIEAVRAMWTLNVETAYQVAHAALPALAGVDGAAMVVVSSQAATQPFAGAAGYLMAKAAVATLAGVISEEGVRCNAIAPRVIDDPPAVAEVIVWLCSDASRVVRGRVVGV